MKLGLDFHGCADSHPEIYAPLTQALINAGHEVHIVTGLLQTKELLHQLDQLGIQWTTWFSITQYHLEQKDVEVKFINGDPWMDPAIWNRSKADYCERAGIDLMIDDSPVYGSYFKGRTVFLLQKDLRAQEAWMVLAGRI